jgi:hypothetical protein
MFTVSQNGTALKVVLADYHIPTLFFWLARYFKSPLFLTFAWPFFLIAARFPYRAAGGGYARDRSEGSGKAVGFGAWGSSPPLRLSAKPITATGGNKGAPPSVYE